MIIQSSINCPTVICFPTVCYFSREKPLVKSTAPGLFAHHIFSDLFCYLPFRLFATFIFRSIFPKTQKYFAALYFIRDLFIQSTTINLPSTSQFLAPLPEGIDNPFNTSGCEYLLFVCRYRSRSVAWFSYWFDNLGLITEGNTYRCCAASSLPLWGNTDVVQANIKRNFWRRCRGGSSQDSLPAPCQFLAPLPGRHHQHLPGS